MSEKVGIVRCRRKQGYVVAEDVDEGACTFTVLIGKER